MSDQGSTGGGGFTAWPPNARPFFARPQRNPAGVFSRRSTFYSAEDPGSPGARSSASAPPGPPPPGGYGPNLRGSMYPPNRPPQSANVNVSIEREPKLSLSKIPDEFEAYPTWVFQAEARIVGCGMPVRDIKTFMVAVRNQTLTKEEYRALLSTDNLESLNVKLYSEVVNACTGTSRKHLGEMQTGVDQGDGIGALRKLHNLMRYETGVVTSKAESQLIKRSCASMDDLEDYISKTKSDLTLLIEAGTPCTETMFYQILKEKLEPYKDKSAFSGISAHFADFDASMIQGQNPSLQVLIEVLHTAGRDHLAMKQENRKRGGRGTIPTDRQKEREEQRKRRANLWCDNCEMRGHTKATCYKLHPELAPDKKGKGKGKNGNRDQKDRGTRDRGNNPNGNQRGGAGAADNGNADRKEKFPACPSCGRKNHAAKDCIYKKPETATGQAASATAAVTSDDGPFEQEPPKAPTAPSSSTGGAPAAPSSSTGGARIDPDAMAFLGFIRGDMPRKMPGRVGIAHTPDSTTCGECNPGRKRSNNRKPNDDGPFESNDAFLQRLRPLCCHIIPPRPGSGDDPEPCPHIGNYECDFPGCDHRMCFRHYFPQMRPDRMYCLHHRDQVGAPNAAEPKPRKLVRGGIGRVRGGIGLGGDRARAAKGIAYDTGASDHIADPLDPYVVKGTKAATYDTTIEAIGSEVVTSETASMKIPGLPGLQDALSVEGSPHCASGGRVVKDHQQIFIWSDIWGPNLIAKDGSGYLRLDDVNNVPMFPTEGRTKEAQDLCDIGFAEEIRRIEEMQDEELAIVASEYSKVKSDFVKAYNASTNLEEYKKFVESPEGLDMRERANATRKRLRKKTPNVGAKPVTSTEKEKVTTDSTGSHTHNADSSDAADAIKSTIASPPSDPLVPANPDTVEDDQKQEESTDAAAKTDAPTTTEPVNIERNLKRKLKTDKLRYEMGEKLAILEGRPPIEHYLTHEPADPRCSSCNTAKQNKAPARSTAGLPDSEKAAIVPDVLGLVHADLVRVRVPDVHGNRWWISTKDQKSNYPRGIAVADKEPGTVWDATQKMYPGTRLVPEEKTALTETEKTIRQSFPRQFGIDGGSEWKGVWGKNVKDRGGKIVTSLPGESKTNSRAERWIETTEKQTACSVDHSGGPIHLWSYSARVFMYNYARSHKNDNGKTPYEEMYGAAFAGDLLVFGCEIQYVVGEDVRDKFESRSKKGAFMMYAQSGGIHVLDLDLYRDGIFRTILTRNFVANREAMPLRDVCKGWDHTKVEGIRMHHSSSDVVPGETYLDENDVLRCVICSLVSTDQPVKCTKCLNRRKHGRGRPTADCKRGRCQGHVTEVEQGIPEEACEPDGARAVVSNDGVATQPVAPGGAPNVAPDPGLPPGLPIVPANLFVPQVILARGNVQESKKKAKLLRAAVAAAASAENAKEKDHFDEIGKIRRAIAYLTRIHHAHDKAVQTNDRALGAVTDEFAQFEKTGTLRPKEVYTRSQIDEQFADPRFVDLMMLVGEKNIEDPQRYKWKARGVALGNRLRNKYGSVIREHLMHSVPAGMESLRFGFGWGLMTKSRGRRGDAIGAYLQAVLSGPPVFISIDESILPPHWTRSKPGEKLYRRVYRSMYGLQRGDTDWGRKARKTIVEKLGARWIGDHGEDSLYIFHEKGAEPTLIIVYSDDFFIVGPEEEHCYNFLCKELNFGEQLSDSHDAAIEEIIGLERCAYTDKQGRACVVLHQQKYALHIVSEFEKKHNAGRPLKPIFTPVIATERKSGAAEQDGLEEQDNELPVPDWVPSLILVKEHLGGEIGWLARGSRPDLCILYRKVSTRYHKWARQDDHLLYRGFQYIKKTSHLGMLFIVDPRDSLDYYITRMRTDADHAGDIESAKSTSGGIVTLAAPYGSRLPIAWWAKKQAYTARSTPEAETVSLDEGSFAYAVPICGVLEEVLNRPVRIISEIDATTAISTVQKGFSRRLAYMKKTRRVSISALHELYFGDTEDIASVDDSTCINRLGHVPGEDNESDLLTKPFSIDRHWELCEKIGLVAVPM